MIYLQNIRESQALIVPKACQLPGGDLVFKAMSTIDRETEIDVQVLDLQVSVQYLFLAVSVPEGSPDGEYEYTITAGGEVVARGLLVIGENTAPDQYEKPITYEQYRN